MSWRTVIDEAKAKITTTELVERLSGPGKTRRIGKELVTNCLLPGHEDQTPSFCVDPDKDVWWCHGCLRGGDVITLAQRVWDIDRTDVAAAELLLFFGHEIPPRPASWFRRQERQKPIRDAIAQAKFDHLRRRLFR